jgi:hypothetical protein
MRYPRFERRVWSLEKVLASGDSGADGRTIMIPSRTCSLSRIAVVALALTVALPMVGAQAQRRGGGGWHGGGWHGGGWHGGGWHGGGWGWRGGGWGWRGGGWGWGGPAFGFAVPPFYYSPPYYYPPPVYYPPPTYPPYPSGSPSYPSGSPYGYPPGYYGSGGTTFNQQPYGQPGYSGLIRQNPNNCGTPDEPKPCRR